MSAYSGDDDDFKELIFDEAKPPVGVVAYSKNKKNGLTEVYRTLEDMQQSFFNEKELLRKAKEDADFAYAFEREQFQQLRIEFEKYKGHAAESQEIDKKKNASLARQLQEAVSQNALLNGKLEDSKSKSNKLESELRLLIKSSEDLANTNRLEQNKNQAKVLQAEDQLRSSHQLQQSLQDRIQELERKKASLENSAELFLRETHKLEIDIKTLSLALDYEVTARTKAEQMQKATIAELREAQRALIQTRTVLQGQVQAAQSKAQKLEEILSSSAEKSRALEERIYHAGHRMQKFEDDARESMNKSLATKNALENALRLADENKRTFLERISALETQLMRKDESTHAIKGALQSKLHDAEAKYLSAAEIRRQTEEQLRNAIEAQRATINTLRIAEEAKSVLESKLVTAQESIAALEKRVENHRSDTSCQNRLLKFAGELQSEVEALKTVHPVEDLLAATEIQIQNAQTDLDSDLLDRESRRQIKKVLAALRTQRDTLIQLITAAKMRLAVQKERIVIFKEEIA